MQFGPDGSVTLNQDEMGAFLPVDVQSVWRSEEIADLRHATDCAISRNSDRKLTPTYLVSEEDVKKEIQKNEGILWRIIQQIDTNAPTDIGEEVSAYFRTL